MKLSFLTRRRLSRSFRRSKKLRWTISRIFAFYIKLCKYTSPIKICGRDNLDSISNTSTGALLALWHGHILVTPLLPVKGKAKYGLISDNRDGDIIARTLKLFDIKAIRGSSQNQNKSDKNKGGAEAAVLVRKVLRNGAVVGITPDGPRGPLYTVQPGIAALSVATQVPIVPVSLSSKYCLQLKTWDLFLLILPFFPKKIYIGEPLYPPEKQDHSGIESYRQQIEASLKVLNVKDA
jgi:lysophospholipid acyltransferase (LPLAT)-like uncharacterized protein